MMCLYAKCVVSSGVLEQSLRVSVSFITTIIPSAHVKQATNENNIKCITQTIYKWEIELHKCL